MGRWEIFRLADQPARKEEAAGWFHEKWRIPTAAYLQSIEQCLRGEAPVPQWYIAVAQGRIIAGLGVIENDFHNRKDLSPNVCAVYVEPAYRNQGLAGELLRFACQDMKARGIITLYLLTDHTGFYERYGWQFLCMVQGDDEAQPSRMYTHREE